MIAAVPKTTGKELRAMQITNRITPAVIQAATAMLSPYVPEISPQSLIAALRAYKIGESPRGRQQEKPYTRKEVADLLGLSVQTVYRMMKTGRLRRIQVGLRAVRIDPASVKLLLDGAAAGDTAE